MTQGFRRIETEDDVREAIGKSKRFADELFSIIDADKEAFANELASGEGDGWIPTVEDIIEKELGGDGFENWIIDNNGDVYELELCYHDGSDTTFMMRYDDNHERDFCGWYSGVPNEYNSKRYYGVN